MAHHEPFKALAPIDWEDVPQDDLPKFLSSSFSSALTIIESIPESTSSPATAAAAAAVGTTTATAPRRPSSIQRARSQTDPPLPSFSPISHPRQSAEKLAHAQSLKKEWKEAKVSAKENPLGIAVYKLAAKDGKGSWFARRSVHEGVGFEKWRLGLEREFAETMKVKGGAGSGSIRGIGAERRVEERDAGVGKMEVFQLSAQFPGPTTPRDFVTLLLTSESDSGHMVGRKPLRSFMVVSKPCNHPECPPRSGFIRGQYESVEIIREIPSSEPAVKRSRSSIDLGGHERANNAKDLGKNAILRAAQSAAAEGRQRSATTAGGPTVEEDEFETLTAIEWLMVTRSDPGGSVPRFMIEKGTPGGIVGDAGKFVRWMNTKRADDFATASDIEEEDAIREAQEAEEGDSEAVKTNGQAKMLASTSSLDMAREEDDETVPSSNGLYSIISQAIGAASSVATRLPNPFASAQGSGSTTLTIPEVEEDVSTISSASSVRSFASAVDTQPDSATSSTMPSTKDAEDHDPILDDMQPPPPNTQAEKELKKIQARRNKFQVRLAKMQSRVTTRQASDRQREEAAIARAREKHERDIAKQKEKYKREMRKLEQKRNQEEKRAEDRRKKAVDKQEKENLKLELERVSEERDIALKEIETLKSQVGELQSQNTMLVARLGRLDKGLERGDSWDVGRGRGRGRTVSSMSSVHS